MSIQFQSLTKRFQSRRILDQVSFEIPEGEILFIIGKSGTGKSVLLKHVVGLLHPDSGQVLVDGIAVERASTHLVRKKIGMVFQQPALLDSFTVLDNVSFGLPVSLNSLEKRTCVCDKLKLVQLPSDILGHYPHELSYGIQKRVSIARALAISPRYLLFDEPTTGLDPLATRNIHQLITELSSRLRVTSVVVSHDMAGALEFARKILVLHEGCILAMGSPDAICKNEHPLIREFLFDSQIPVATITSRY